MRRRLWGLLAILLVVNLGVMAADALWLTEQGGVQVAPVTPPPRSQQRLPVRPPNQVELFLRSMGVRPVGTERPQPDPRPLPSEPRARTPGQVQPGPSLRPFSLHQAGAGGMALHLVALLSLVSMSVILTFFAPDRLRVMRDVLGGPWVHKLRTLMIGALGYLVALLLAAMMAALVSGLIYSLVAVALLAVLTGIGVTGVALAIGKWLMDRTTAAGGPVSQLIAGILVIFPLTIFPYYLGWVAAALIASFGMGAILLTRLGSGRNWSLDVLQ